jgi:hypothetical protein
MSANKAAPHTMTSFASIGFVSSQRTGELVLIGPGLQDFTSA